MSRIAPNWPRRAKAPPSPIWVPWADRVFVIAEAGTNWILPGESRQGSLNVAQAMIQIAHAAGADAVKFQGFSGDLYAQGAGDVGGVDVAEVIPKLAMPPEAIPALASMCEAEGVQFMCSAFSPAGVRAVDPFVQVHKVASSELQHAPLLRAVNTAGKPLVLSTGGHGFESIKSALVDLHDVPGLCLMHCVVSYPTPVAFVGLRGVQALGVVRWMSGAVPGYSDHTAGAPAAAVAAVALGARTVERHFTLDRKLPGPDHHFAMEPDDLLEWVVAVRQAELMCQPPPASPEQVKLRRQTQVRIHALRDIAKGDLLVYGESPEQGNIGVRRPGNRRPGAYPMNLNQVDGRRATRTISAGAGVRLRDCK